MSSPDPLDSAIPVGNGSTVPPAGTPAPSTPEPGTQPTPPPATPPPIAPTQLVRTTPSGSDKVWAILCHVSSFLGVPFLLPLVVYLAMRHHSAYAAENAREALNFHISLLIYSLCLLPLTFILIGIPLLIVLGLAALVISVIAAFKASEGAVYRYPLTIRLVS